MLSVELNDELCPWNAGTWTIEMTGDETSIDRTEQQPDMRMPIASMATLLAGHQTATVLSRGGLIEAQSPDALRLADRMFATDYAPWCPNNF